jgi:hypothetical protein
LKESYNPCTCATVRRPRPSAVRPAPSQQSREKVLALVAMVHGGGGRAPDGRVFGGADTAAPHGLAAPSFHGHVDLHLAGRKGKKENDGTRPRRIDGDWARAGVARSGEAGPASVWRDTRADERNSAPAGN